MIERQAVGGRLVEQLDAEIPLREIARLDRFPQVAAVEIGIGAVDLHRLVPQHRLQALLRLPMEFDEGGFARVVDQPEAVHSETLDRAERARDRAIGHDPHDHVPGFGAEADEIPEIVVRGLRLRELAIGLGLGGVDQIGELDRILNEEHRNIVADDVPIALAGVKFDREASDGAREVG